MLRENHNTLRLTTSQVQLLLDFPLPVLGLKTPGKIFEERGSAKASSPKSGGGKVARDLLHDCPAVKLFGSRLASNRLSWRLELGRIGDVLEAKKLSVSA